MAANVAPVHVGQADVEQHEIEAPAACEVERLGAGRRLRRVEFLVQAQLFDERLAQRFVVLDEQDSLRRACGAHGPPRPERFVAAVYRAGGGRQSGARPSARAFAGAAQ